MKRFFTLSLLLILCGCAEQRTTSSPQLNNLAETYAAIALLKAKLSLHDSTVTIDSYTARVTQILTKHGYTAESFQSEMKRLCDSPDRMNLFAEAVSRGIDTTR